MNIQKRLKELQEQEIKFNDEINRVNAYLQNANRQLIEIVGAIKELNLMEAEGKKDGKNGQHKGSKSRSTSK